MNKADADEPAFVRKLISRGRAPRRYEDPGSRSLPRGPFELAFLFRLLAELLVVILAQVGASRIPDQLEFRKYFLNFLRREGALRILPASLNAAHRVGGHPGDDVGPDICTCAVENSAGKTETASRDYSSRRRSIRAAATLTKNSAPIVASSEPGSKAGAGGAGGMLVISMNAEKDGR